MRGHNRSELPYIMIRLTQDQKKAIEAAAKREGFQAVAEWARVALLAKATPPVRATQ